MDEFQLYRDGRELIEICERIVLNSRKVWYEAVHGNLDLLTKMYGAYAEAVAGLQQQSAEYGFFPDIACLTNTISDVLEAERAKDYIMLADYVELSLKPMLLQVQDGLRQVFGDLGNVLSEETEANNLINLPILARQLKNVKPYVLEETNVGYATVALNDEVGSYYFHSNVNPVREAMLLIDDYYVPSSEKYIMIGAGLGYGVRALLKKNQFSKVTVYETDARMLKSMLSYLDLSNYIKNKRLNIILDDKLEHLRYALTAEDTTVIMHEPSIRNIKDKSVKDQLYKYFYKESGLRKNSDVMEANFYQNYRNCRSNVDELESVFAGKKVVVVAAGPSLVKHYELLKNKPDDVVIVAVTTIYKKLLDEGIRPDYVVHIDTNQKTFWHIRDIKEDVPLLVLSTAYEGCARVYPGRSYIIYQEGYDLAEEKAEMGYRLYETGGSVTCVALDVPVRLGAKEVILIGLDLAYTAGLAHAEGTHAGFNNKVDVSNAHMVNGYYGDKVPSTLVFEGFINWFSDYAARHKEAKIINSTEGGADIPGIEKMPFKEALGV